jgi:hypothetical protein
MWDVRMCQHLHKTDAAWTWHVPSSGSNFFFRKKEFEPVLIFDAGSAPVPADRCICAACDMRGYDAVANSRIRITVTNCAVCYPLYPTVLIPFYIVFFPRRITSIRHILCLLERKKKGNSPNYMAFFRSRKAHHHQGPLLTNRVFVFVLSFFRFLFLK